MLKGINLSVMQIHVVEVIIITTVTKMPRFYTDFIRSWKDHEFVHWLRTVQWLGLFLVQYPETGKTTRQDRIWFIFHDYAKWLCWFCTEWRLECKEKCEWEREHSWVEGSSKEGKNLRPSPRKVGYLFSKLIFVASKHPDRRWLKSQAELRWNYCWKFLNTFPHPFFSRIPRGKAWSELPACV